MGTVAAILVPVEDETNFFHYVRVNWDGYPGNMMPILDAITTRVGIDKLYEDVLTAKEIRSLNIHGIEPFQKPNLPLKKWGMKFSGEGYLYYYRNGEWHYVENS